MSKHTHILHTPATAVRKACRRAVAMAVCVLMLLVSGACEREPILHLHRGNTIDLYIPVVELELKVFWDYENESGIPYDWQAEWHYGWDDLDREIFGELGYTIPPHKFHIRGYYNGDDPAAPHEAPIIKEEPWEGNFYQLEKFSWGYWDFLAWNDIHTLDEVQSLRFDESSHDNVIAYTGYTTYSSRYSAPRYTRSFYQPEALFREYTPDVDLTGLDQFTFQPDRGVYTKDITMRLTPCTYIYLTQVILHNNKGRIVSVNGIANLSGMARTMNLNTGVAGSDPITVNYSCRLKPNCTLDGKNVDIVGGRLMTFGMCNINGASVRPSYTKGDNEPSVNDGNKHYMDLVMKFNNDVDSTFVFDVTDQVQKRYKGGVITIELDVDKIPIPDRDSGGTGSGFDAVVKDFEDGGTHEFEMTDP